MSHEGFFHKLEASFIFTFIGIVLLFSTSIIVILIAPSYIDPSWVQPTSLYQMQMYEVSDPHVYIGTSLKGGQDLQFIQHLKKGYTLSAFQETEQLKILASNDLDRYITRTKEEPLKLTSRTLLLRPAKEERAKAVVEKMNREWEAKNPRWKEEGIFKPTMQIMELYDSEKSDAFALAPPDLIVENWIDQNFILLDKNPEIAYQSAPGVIYVNNPVEYRLLHYPFNGKLLWKYDEAGEPIKSLEDLKGHELGFLSKKELISMGEQLFAAEGCWYCHTDQTRTLVQDVVMNGSAEYPAPPSSANEYIYQKITFPGTRRIGPDLSRVGIKKPSRDWHKGHFWAPKTASKGSIMPSFRHFFDNDPRGTSKALTGVPNLKFEAIFQYLMTKGTRITPPSEAWWLGKDPVDTKAIIEGKERKSGGGQ